MVDLHRRYFRPDQTASGDEDFVGVRPFGNLDPFLVDLVGRQILFAITEIKGECRTFL